MIDSRGMDFPRWANATNIIIAAAGTIPIAFGESEWPAWARIVTALPAFAAVGCPGPEAFTDWKMWVHAFNQQARLAGFN